MLIVRKEQNVYIPRNTSIHRQTIFRLLNSILKRFSINKVLGVPKYCAFYVHGLNIFEKRTHKQTGTKYTGIQQKTGS